MRSVAGYRRRSLGRDVAVEIEGVPEVGVVERQAVEVARDRAAAGEQCGRPVLGGVEVGVVESGHLVAGGLDADGPGGRNNAQPSAHLLALADALRGVGAVLTLLVERHERADVPPVAGGTKRPVWRG